MTDERANQPPAADSDFVQQVSAKAARKLRVQKNGQQTVWFGLGMSGLIGWSVAVPNRCWCNDRPVVGQPSSRSPFMDTHFVDDWALRGLRKCLALGGSGEQSHARRAGGPT